MPSDLKKQVQEIKSEVRPFTCGTNRQSAAVAVDRLADVVLELIEDKREKEAPDAD